MVEEYRVIDLCYFYEEIGFDRAFLVLSAEKNKANVERKIRLENGRLLNVKYQENEDVRVIFINEKTGQYENKVIPCKRGIYGLFNMLEERILPIGVIDDDSWIYKKSGYVSEEETLIVSDNAVLIDGSINLDKKELIVRNREVIEGTKVPLTYIGRYNLYDDMDNTIFDKCLKGERLTITDFCSIVDDEFPYGYLQLNFGSLQIEIYNDEISMKKTLNGRCYVNEEIKCCLAKDRVVMTSMFLVFVLKAESEKRLMKRLEEYYIDVG